MLGNLRTLAIFIKHSFYFAIYVFIFLIYFIPRIYGLGADISNIDARKWIPRTDNFTQNLLSSNFEGTYQKYHPGTVLMWLSSGGDYFFQKYLNAQSSDFIGENIKIALGDKVIGDNSNYFVFQNFARKLPVIFVIAIVGVLQFWYLKRLVNARFAFLFAVTLSVEPFFLGITRFLHLTGLSTMFGFASALSMIYFLKTNRLRYTVIGGVLLALAISTKVSLLINGFVYAGFFVYYFIFHLKQFNLFKGRFNRKFVLAPVIFLLSLIGSSYVINPFLWQEPMTYILKIYNEGILDTGFEDEIQPTIMQNNMLFYFEYSLYRLTPYTFVFAILGSVLTIIYALVNYLFLSVLIAFRCLVKVARLTAYFSESQLQVAINYLKKFCLQHVGFYMVIYLVIYYFLLSYPSKSRDRYLAELIPMIVFFAVLFVEYVYILFLRVVTMIFSLRYLKLLPTQLIVIIGHLFSWIIVFGYLVCVIGYAKLNFDRYHPVYSFYYSDLIGGASGLSQLGITPMLRGEWYAQVALFLNSTDPDISQKDAWILDAGSLDSFRSFFNGNAVRDTLKFKQYDTIEYVLVRNGKTYEKLGQICTEIKAFGPRGYNGYEALYLFDCTMKNLNSVRNRIGKI